MPSRIAPGLALLLMTSCAKAPSTPPETPVAPPASATATSATSAPSAPSAVALPRATRATAGRVEGVIATVEGETVKVGDVNVGAGDDVLVSTLQARADSWKGAHPGAPAVLGLRASRTTSARLVTRLFRSAALAGYSRVAIAVESAGAEAHLDVDTSAAPRPTVTGEPDKDLHLLLVPGSKVTLEWRMGAVVVSALDRTWGEAIEQGGLAATVTNEWKAVGTHRDPSDRQVDHAAVAANDDADLAAIVSAIDAILATTRSFAGTPGPAFAVAFESPREAATGTLGAGGTLKSGPVPSIRVGQTTTTGNLPPEIVQRIVRQNLGRLRLCYENGLRSKPALGGEIVVHFTIGADGSVRAVSEKSATLKDAAMSQCVSRVFKSLSFPAPEGGTVDVLYPITFAPPPAP